MYPEELAQLFSNSGYWYSSLLLGPTCLRNGEKNCSFHPQLRSVYPVLWTENMPHEQYLSYLQYLIYLQ